MQGFGEPSGEHWLGNDIIHKLTTSKEYSLHILLKDREGNEAFSHYERFYIDGEENNYGWSYLVWQWILMDFYLFKTGISYYESDILVRR